jgi:aminoglycoside phosphotransferase (APT) family kinase protein/SAM-dependent methyltransferase
MCCGADLAQSRDELKCGNCGLVAFLCDNGVYSCPDPGQPVSGNGPGLALYEAVKCYGWRDGFARFLNSQAPSVALPLLDIGREKEAGWRFLLDINGTGGGKSVLVIESGMHLSATALAVCFDGHVASVHRDRYMAGVSSIKAMEEDASNLQVFWINDLKRLPFKDSSFDAVVINDIEGRSSDECPVKGVDAKGLFMEAGRVLKGDGCILSAWANTNPVYLRLKKMRGAERGPALGSLFSSGVKGVADVLMSSGFSIAEAWAVYPGVQPIRQIIPMDIAERRASSSRRSVVSRWLVNKVKGSKLKHWVMPAFAITARRPLSGDSFVEGLGRELSFALNKPGLRLLSYRLGNPDVVILMYGERDRSSEARVVARVPLTGLSMERCSRNMRSIGLIRGGPAPFAPMVPAPIKEGEFGGKRYFAETAVKGMVADESFEDMATLIIKASDLIAGFHSQTARPTKFDAGLFDRHFEAIFADIKASVDRDAAKGLDCIIDSVRERLCSLSIPLVFMHGDYKSENLVMDPSTGAINGVIDWDMSSELGLPLLDVCYLLAYRHVTHDNMRFSDSIISLMRLNPKGPDARILDGYRKAIGLDIEALNPLILMFWLHHIGQRFGRAFRQYRPWMKENFYSILPTALKLARGRGTAL